jgi:hypothetical protein
MFEACESLDESDVALRNGLRQLPQPVVSSDFDARVLARLSRPEPWTRQAPSLLTRLRPAFGAAVVTVPCALVLITFLGRAPESTFSPGATPAQAAQALPLDQAFDRPDLSPSAFRRMSREEAASRGRGAKTISRTQSA